MLFLLMTVKFKAVEWSFETILLVALISVATRLFFTVAISRTAQHRKNELSCPKVKLFWNDNLLIISYQ